PPRLHVVFLERSSPDAVSRESGDWVTNANPLWTAASGFRLTATLSAKPAVQHTVVIPPEYGCMGPGFQFSGEPGGAAQAGATGQGGCPPQPGGPGGSGGNGAPGGSGGRGGRVTIIVPTENPFLAGLIEARSPGGQGGPGGTGGNGGKGGKGGPGTADKDNRRCADAADGSTGQKRTAGTKGPEGGP